MIGNLLTSHAVLILSKVRACSVSDAFAWQNYKRAQESSPAPLPGISPMLFYPLQFPVVICIRIDDLGTGSIIAGCPSAFCSRAPAAAG